MSECTTWGIMNKKDNIDWKKIIFEAGDVEVDTTKWEASCFTTDRLVYRYNK